MRDKRQLSVIALCTVLAAACSTDVETAKRRYVESGDRYLKQQKHNEAVIQYRNALAKDPRFGEAHLKLGRTFEQTGDVKAALGEYVRAADLMPDNSEAQLLAGKMLVAARQFAEAKARAQAVLAKEPRNVNALIVMGNALAGLKDVDGAITQIEGAIDAEPQLTFSYTNLGLLQLRKGDRDAAEATFKRAIAVAPESIEAHLTLANFYWAVGEGANAENEFKTALRLDPKSKLANQLLASLFLLNGRRPDAERYLKAYADADGSVSAKLVLADYYLLDRRISEATAVLEPLSREKRGFAPAKARLAAIDFQAGRRQQGYDAIELILKDDAKNAVALETKARFLIVEGKQRDAVPLLDTILSGNPRAVRAAFLRGTALRSLGQLDAAIAAMQSVAQQAPGAMPVQMQLAELYLLKRDPKTAIDRISGVLKVEPQNGMAHLIYGQALLDSGNLARAEAEFTPLALANPSRPEVHVSLGRLYLAKNDRPRARQAFTKALELQPDSIFALDGVVTLDVADKQLDAVRTRLKSRLDASPKDPRLLFLAGNTYLTIGDTTEAESLFQRVLEIEPANFDAYQRLGKLYVSQHRIDEAQKTFAAAVQTNANPVAFATLLGMVLELQNKPDEALKSYEQALAFDPQAPVAANNLAWMYARRGENLDIALRLAQTAKSRLPNASQVNDTLGWVYYQKGLASLAVTSLKQAADQDPANAPIQYRLGLAYLKNGDTEQAHAALQRALRLNPRFDGADDARRALGEIKG